MIYLVYLALAIAVVLLAVRLSYYVDVLDRKTNLSGAFIGGVMLAAVTSLPELFTALTAVIAIDRPQLVQGDIFGSNVFNLCVIGVLILFTYQNYRRSSLSKTHKSTIIYSLIMYALAFIGMLKPMEISLGVLNVNLMSILILVVYGINVLFMKNDESAENENEDNCHLSVIQVVIRFILYSVSLVCVSILLTHVTDQVAEELNLGATAAGAIFLGIATSLPELSASINLVRMKNYNASFGNIVGSNLFNFTILCFADLVYSKGSIFISEPQALNLLGFGAFSSLLAYLLIRFKKSKWLVILSCILILASYVLSIVLSV
ncbi:MAG: sodium:calcium antiporter [Erysipelotrichaceae bacterium]|nr:sodium:calcium antiporter [Erysipelotrichaceae bacterium]